MTGEDPVEPPERDLFAGEYVIGLLSGSDLMEARRLEREDPAFADAVAAWEERLMPLAFEAPARTPDPAVWTRIRGAILAEPTGTAEVVQLRRRVRIWQGVAAAAAIAATLALSIGLQRAGQEPPAIVRPQPEQAPLLIAALASPESETLASITYDTDASTLIVTPGRIDRPSGQDHELWVIPVGGQPVSLGVVNVDSGPQRVLVDAEVARHLRARSTLALSVEPRGGSPTGLPTGPVIASGEVVVV